MLFAAVTLLAGLGYATFGGVTISGTECTQQTISTFEAGTELMSECPNPIQIVELVCGINPVPPNLPIPYCNVGRILNNGGVCKLPFCD